ncbi:hypothetical protein K2Y11_20950 [bacterium]|nr:hypothetical protein [bacterium]
MSNRGEEEDAVVQPPIQREGIEDRLAAWLGEVVVIDCTHPYVAIGTLVRVARDYVELAEADMHDLRDSTTSRENYLVKTARHGVGATRRLLIFRMEHIVGISPLAEVVQE